MTANREWGGENRQRRKAMVTIKTRVDGSSFYLQISHTTFLPYSFFTRTEKNLLVYSDQQSGLRRCEMETARCFVFHDSETKKFICV